MSYLTLAQPIGVLLRGSPLGGESETFVVCS